MSEKKLQFELMKKDKQIADLYVVIDTLQTNMRSVSSYLNKDKKKEIETQSFKWCMSWKQGDEKS
jgi:hypothetical protein